MITVNQKTIQDFTFPGGEVHVNLAEIEIGNRTTIWAFLDNAEEIMKLLMTVDAVRRLQPNTTIELHIPYLPYARQDRVCNTGEALAVKVMANLINDLRADSVTIYDPHSDVASALVENVKIIQQETLLQELAPLIQSKQLALVAPDAGAEKKTLKFAQTLPEGTEVLFGSKVRNTKTGQITETTVRGDVTGRKVLIIDDICDGGRTFIELAKVLRAQGAEEVYLYVTHGIFSKGLEPLAPHFDHIYSYFIFPDVKATEQLTILNKQQ